MPRYVAFLRAINVGGRTVKMDRLRDIFESLGLTEVETFIASGNVIFRSRSTNPAALEKKIEAQLRKSLGFDVSTLIRSTSELSDIVALDAFPGAVKPTSTLYVGLLKSAPDEGVRQQVLAFRTSTDEFRLEGRELYWLCHTKSMDSIFSGGRLEKTVRTAATFRNVTTLRKLAEKYCE
jgi:uncharacterized protein (DUF1697 family)